MVRPTADPPARRPSSRAAQNSKKRQEKFETNEAARAPEQRLTERTDWTQPIVREAARRTMDKYLMVLSWFEDFSHHFLHNPEGDSKKYFRSGGPRPSVSIVRHFLSWIADTHRGVHGNLVIRLNTLGGYLDALWGAVKYFNARFPKEETEQHKLWLTDELTSEANLNLMPLETPVAYPHDVTYLLRLLYRPNVLAKFPSMHQVLQFNLLLNLNIDLMGRIGELLLVGTRDEDDEESKSQWIKYLLTWRRATLWLYPQEDGSIKFNVVLKITGMKGQKRDPGSFKDIPLRSLSPDMVFEDSCRLMLYLAITEGHLEIEGLDGLASIQDLQTNGVGTMLQIKEASLDLPVFQQSDLTGEITGRPVAYHPFAEWLNRLSRAAGIVNFSVTSRCMRRGIAYHLNRSTDVDTRKQLMGHRENSRVFSKYQAKTAQVDAQAILRGLPETEVTKFSSILNGRIPGAPEHLSSAGLNSVATSSSMVEARVCREDALKLLLESFPNTSAAKEASSPLYASYKEAAQKMHNLQTSMNRVQYAVEVKGYAQRNAYALPSDTKPFPSDTESLTSKAQSSYEREADELLLYQASNTADPIMADVELCIDPELLKLSNKPSLTKDTITGSPGQSQSPNEALDEPVLAVPSGPQGSSQLRLHQVVFPRIILNSCPRPTIADGVFDQIVESDLSHKDVDDVVMPLLSVKHSLTRFPRHLMPVPGTKNCYFCGESWDLWEISNLDLVYASRFYHVKECARKALRDRTKIELDEALEAAFRQSPGCPWIRQKPPPCPVSETGLVNATTWADHLLGHRTGSKSHCRIGQCGVRLSSPAMYKAHAWDKHSIPFEGLFDEICQWCDWCEDYRCLTPGSTDEEEHFGAHLPQAFQSVKAYGYGYCHDGQRPLVPAKCIFCLHDRQLSSKARLTFPLSPENRSRHLWRHVAPETIEGLDGCGTAYCPASALSGTEQVFCAYDSKMNSHEMKEHLSKVHAVETRRYGLEKADKKGKRPAKTSEQTDLDDAVIEGHERADDPPVLGTLSTNAYVTRKDARAKRGKLSCKGSRK